MQIVAFELPPANPHPVNRMTHNLICPKRNEADEITSLSEYRQSFLTLEDVFSALADGLQRRPTRVDS
jgi:hypothetical protein